MFSSGCKAQNSDGHSGTMEKYGGNSLVNKPADSMIACRQRIPKSERYSYSLSHSLVELQYVVAGLGRRLFSALPDRTVLGAWHPFCQSRVKTSSPTSTNNGKQSFLPLAHRSTALSVSSSTLLRPQDLNNLACLNSPSICTSGLGLSLATHLPVSC